MDKIQKKIFEDIKKFGWHILQVSASDTNPPWAFTIGLFKTHKHPEVIIFGLDDLTLKTALNKIAESVKSGTKYEAGKKYSGIFTGTECYFLEVDKKWYTSFLSFARATYQTNDFPSLQCVWPDEDGNYPWQRQFKKEWSIIQPLLGDKVGAY